jgi:hypothetical protein
VFLLLLLLSFEMYLFDCVVVVVVIAVLVDHFCSIKIVGEFKTRGMARWGSFMRGPLGEGVHEIENYLYP